MQQAYSWQWVEAQVAQTIEVWHGSASQPARVCPQYCLKQQRQREQAYDAALREVEREARRAPRTRTFTPASKDRSPGTPTFTPASKDRSPGTPTERLASQDRITASF